MSKFKIQPIDKHIVDTVRQTMTDQYGHSLNVAVAPNTTGLGHCRSCLKEFNPGDERILFSYKPSEAGNPYDEIGPVFIHKNECEHYSDTNEFPKEVKKRRIPKPFVLRGYDKQGNMSGTEIVQNGEETENTIDKLFSHPEIDYLQIRNVGAGCFIAKVVRD